MLITDAGTITTGRFGVTASRPALGGIMSFGVGQRLLAIDGEATNTTGTGFDLASRSLIFSERQFSLAGKMRPKLTFGYERRGERSAFRFGAASDLTAQDIQALASWSVRF